MNRQIKFRAWDKLGKHMYYANPHFSLDFLGKVYNLQNGAAGDDFELMQYVNLKDKDGKEIYEGDIVILRESRSIRDCKVLVSYNYMAFTFKYLSSMRLESFIPMELEIGQSSIGGTEIIGNMFENPELLPAK